MSSGRYSLIRKIGAGGMAEVWKASASGAAGFRKTVAIKRVLPNLGSDPEFVRRFVEEARVAAALVHPNIVQVFDFGELETGVYFLAMEYVPGTTLSGLGVAAETRGRRLPPEVILYAAAEVSKALGHAHTRSPAIIHRDVSPQNVLISFDGDVKLADFGIAKVAGTSTEAQTVRGKVGYLSPEQISGKPVDARSDLFSLGVMVYRLLTGRDLYPGVTMAERLASAGRFDGLTAEQLSGLPASLRPTLRQALAVDPADRFQSAEEMEGELSAQIDGGATIVVRRTLASLASSYFPEEHRLQEKEASGPEDADARSTVNTVDIRPGRARRRALGKYLAIGGGAAALLLASALLGERYMPFAIFSTGDATPIAVAPSPMATPIAVAPSPTATPIAAAPSPAAALPSRPATAKPTRVAVAPTPRRTPAPIASPAATATPRIVRQIPSYDGSLLDGCTAPELALARASILGAIRRGAPKFNAGDVLSCYEIYRDSAAALRGALPESCPGPRAGLQSGLDRAARLATPAEKAWAMRDEFDGLLAVLPAQ